MAEVIVEGLDDLLASMDALPLALQKNLIVRSLRKGGEPIAEEMERTAPDDPETPGSRIERNIRVQVSDQTATGAVARIGPTSGGFPAIFAEVGSAHQTARPFIGPAFEATKDDALKLVGDVIGSGIEAEFAKKRR